jgi:hypothetical protein
MRAGRSLGRDLLAPSLCEVGADRLTAPLPRDTRSIMSAVLIGEREQVDATPTKLYPPLAHNDRFALNEDSPFLLLAAAVVQQARVDQAHQCSSNCQKSGQCQRAAISARLFLTALHRSNPALGGVWLDWMQYAAVRAGLTPRRRRGYSP